MLPTKCRGDSCILLFSATEDISSSLFLLQLGKSTLGILVWDQTLNKEFWEQIQQITTVPMTFVQATFVLGTFVHISNISAVTGPIWIKL